MSRYRKKPVVIDARQWNGTFEDGNAILDWLVEREATTDASVKESTTPVSFTIGTLEGAMTVSPGDYVIVGVQHEAYPCKPDIFEATYEAVAS